MSKDAKNVPTLRFKGYSDAWEKRCLSDVLKVNSGRDYKHLSAGTVPVYGTGGYMLSVNKALSNQDAIGIGRKGTIDRPYLLNAPFWTVDTLFYLTMKAAAEITFVFPLLQRIHWKKLDESTGVPSLSKRVIETLSVYVPDKKEQQTIGNLFFFLDQLIAATQDKIGALEQVKETLSKNLFDQSWRFKEYSTPWKENKLKDIVSAYSGGTPSANIRTYYGGHIPFIRSAEIHSSTTALTLTQEGLKNSSAKLVKTGDILYALYGANSGDVDRSKINGAINQAILAMRPSKENDSNFILFQLMRMKNKIVSTYLQGGQGNLSGRIILALNLDMPESTSEQRTIGRSLQLLCELISVNQSKYSQLESLKKSLLQNLFV
ncbi:restriction endonuclease subunit S [Lacticaseibacillus paracasei]|uniref:restriction endonuclease subunit S n=1 Tax=Lacticaseibacillus paracasei TaxID=1597 RepID=UPI00237F0572|nr:restriction endonuclease subunit S [Lacticaseibacillus paracasei]MDE3280203.1 restriction endonuclease subunit S [Lacticaseibacillus paracasei]